MAKKIQLITDDYTKAQEALRNGKIEHVYVEYKEKNNFTKKFIVVLNKHRANAVALIKAANIDIKRVSNYRHYEMLALSHKHYLPTFECTCRGCGKSFKHADANAKWCNKECKQSWRKAKKML
jgi:hypothetical protein